MGAVEGTLEELIARDSLRRLVIAYSRAVDRRDFALLRSLYEDDAVERHGDMFCGGPDAYMSFVGTALESYEATVHYVVNCAFEIDGAEAQGEVHKINYHRTRGVAAVDVITGSRSFDRYRRRDGVWRFAARTIALDWAIRRPVDAAGYADFAAQSPMGRADATDLSYSLLSRFARHAPSPAADQA